MSLDWYRISEIRGKYRNGEDVVVLSGEYNVSVQSIRNIIMMRTWR